MFGDFATIPVFCFTIGFCFLIEQLSYKFGQWFKIWKIDPNIEYNVTGTQDLDKDFWILLIRIDEFQREEDL
jgi:hypothetical protein